MKLSKEKIRSIVDNWENNMQDKGYQGRDIWDLEELIDTLAQAIIKARRGK